MGPRSDERGNRVPAGESARMLIRLQWGRAPMSAEMLKHTSRNRPRRALLQWGRAPMSAEIRERTRSTRQGGLHFNGAALR